MVIIKTYIKKGAVLYIFLAFVFILSSCGGNSSNAAATNAANASDSVNASGSGGNASANQADLYGEVKSITGSDITLALLVMPAIRQGAPGNGQQRQRPSGQGSQSGGQGTQGSQNQQGQGNGNGTSNPSRGFGGGIAGQRQYTGETITITVPADAQITTFSRGSGNGSNGGNTNGGTAGTDSAAGTTAVTETTTAAADNSAASADGATTGTGSTGAFRNRNMQQTKIALSDIKVGDILQVWYKPDNGDKKEVQIIRVVPVQPSNQNQNQNGILPLQSQ